MNGDICWVDLGVRDVELCAFFYAELFGWSIAEPDEDGYRLASLHGHLVAALGQAESPGPPYWTVYAETDDAARSVRAAINAGGALLQKPQQAGSHGTAAAVSDPAGAPLSLWQPGSHLGSWISDAPGTLAGVELRTDDPSAVSPFMRDVLGWERAGGDFRLDGRVVTTVIPASVSLGSPAGSPWLVRFRAGGDIAQQTVAALQLGATIVNADSLILADPAGSHFGLSTLKGGTLA